jgi:UDP:flavonoid glycosyltransferase YjiC (YdhE family)
MGTLMNGLVDVYRTITAAAAKRKEVQLVLSIGDQLDPEQIGPLANNTIVVKRAPQLQLLKRTSVCITHARARHKSTHRAHTTRVRDRNR